MCKIIYVNFMKKKKIKLKTQRILQWEENPCMDSTTFYMHTKHFLFRFEISLCHPFHIS